MIKVNTRKSAGVLVAMAITSLMMVVPAQAKTMAVDPAAVQSLKRMTDYLSGLQQFSVHSQNTLEHVTDAGQRIDEDISVSMTLSRPGKLQAKRLGELLNQSFYYDGKTLTLHNQNENVYASEQVPGTIEEMLDYARESLGLVLPASDLAYRNVHQIMMRDVTSATVIGKSVINGKTCEHLAFTRDDVDFQVWIETGDRPLPCKLVVTDKSTPELVSTTSVLSNWNVKPSIPQGAFKFVPVKGAMKVEFLPLDKNDSGANQ